LIQEGIFHIYPIAESAITIECGKEIAVSNHRRLLQLQKQLQIQAFSGFTDTSITYNTLTVFFDPRRLITNGQHSPLAFVLKELQTLVRGFGHQPDTQIPPGKHHLIPVCYDPALAPDLLTVAAYHKTSPDAIIEAHTGQDWYVFMIGFNPGFPYMGVLPPTLAMPRKSTPAAKVAAGSVGIAGTQTGIYPNDSPGGWQIIGRTPLKIFSPEDPSPVLFSAGDTVRFTPIDSDTFSYLNQYANS